MSEYGMHHVYALFNVRMEEPETEIASGCISEEKGKGTGGSEAWYERPVEGCCYVFALFVAERGRMELVVNGSPDCCVEALPDQVSTEAARAYIRCPLIDFRFDAL